MDDQRDVTSARTASIDTAGATTCVATPRLAVAPCAAVTPLSSDDMVAANENRSSLRQNAARVVHVRRTARQRRGNRGNTYSVCAPYPLWCWPATQGAPFGDVRVRSILPAAVPTRPEKRKVKRTAGQKRTV